ncbi:MAG TPA: signal peptidase II [Candidatus Limnocylindrales bacterium]|nr:signal peptidase II [Candidatus Limnocylindrales bacterium]
MVDRRRWYRRWATFFALAGVVIVIDQVTKQYVDMNFPVASVHAAPGLAEPTPIIDGIVRIAKTYNTGGIFGFFGDSAVVLALASTVVIALIVIYQWREGVRGPWQLTVALGLLLGGALGNFIDRIRLQAVVDFVDMGLGDWRWYTFNVADAAISMALLLLIVMSVFGDRFTTRVAAQPQD